MFHSLLFSPKLGCRWPRSLYWLTVKRGCVIQFYLSKSPILSGQKHYFSIRIVFIYDKRPFSSHSWACCPSSLGWSYIFSPPIFGDSSSKLAFIVKKRVAWTAQKMSLGPGGEIRAELHMVMVLVVLASTTPTPDLRFPHIWKLHVTKFELQAAKTIWRKLELTQVSILLLRSK